VMREAVRTVESPEQPADDISSRWEFGRNGHCSKAQP